MTHLDNLLVLYLSSAACGIMEQCFGSYAGNRWWKKAVLIGMICFSREGSSKVLS